MTSASPGRCIVVSGLPASGKSCVGATLAAALGADLFDKDDYLERLYETRGIGDIEWRRRLSRESDRQFERAARSSRFAVLVSHWRPPGSAETSGTPCDWIAGHFDIVIELYCECPVEIAAARFRQRRRHPGHLDDSRDPAEIERWMLAWDRMLPLGIGPLLRLDTTAAVPVDLPTRIEAALNGDFP